MVTLSKKLGAREYHAISRVESEIKEIGYDIVYKDMSTEERMAQLGKLRGAKLALSLVQEHIAEYFGIHPASVTSWHNGKIYYNACRGSYESSHGD